MIHPHGYFYENVYRKNKRNGRTSRGILVYYKKELKNNLTFLEKSSENILLVKIAKGYLHTDREVYLAGVYNSPKHSNYTKENNCNVVDILREQLSKFSSAGIIFIGGDFNSRVGTPDDFIIESENDLGYLPQDNQDISINEYGQQLLDLCIAAKLRIFNGRTRRDLQGYITYIGNKGYSTVDLVVASEICCLQSGLVQYPSVLDLNRLSDHRPILLKFSSLHPISTHPLRNQTEPKNVTLEEKQPQYK